MTQTVEVYGHIDSNGFIQLNTPLPLREGDVKVIIMYGVNDDMSEEELWLKSVSNNPAFAFLREPEEDIYSINDGKPLND